MKAFDFWITLAFMLIATANALMGNMYGLVLACTFLIGQYIRIYGGNRNG